MYNLNYHISLDLLAGDSQGMLCVKAGDTARGIFFALRQRGSPYEVSSDVQVVLTARKADGNILFHNCEGRQEGIYAPFTSQLTAVPGEVLCELRLYGEEGKLLTCPRFSILVEPPVVEDGEIVESSPEFTALTELLEETREIKEAWAKLLEEGQGLPSVSRSLLEFDRALERLGTEDPTGIPVLDPVLGFRPMWIRKEKEEGELWIPTMDTLRRLLEEQERGLDFDGGYVDGEGFLHLTLGGGEIEGFEPFYIGSASEAPGDLILEGDRLYLAKDGEPMGEGVTLPTGGGTGSGTGSTMKLLNRNPNSTFSVMDTAKEAMLLYSWSSVDSEDGSPTGKGSASWFVGDKRVATQSVDQGEGSFNILPFLEAGVDNTVKLTIEDAYGTTRSRVWTVKVISFSLTWDLEKMDSHPAAPMAIRLIPSGMGEKTLRLFLDGEEHFSQTVISTGRTVTVELPALSHGVHRITATLELVSEGETVSTEPLTHVGIWYEEGNTRPVVAFFDTAVEVPQYATASIPYLVYDPMIENAAIALYHNDTELRTLTVGRGMQNWAYRPTTEGQTSLKIKVMGTETQAVLPVTVTPLGYDIAPVTAGLVMECTPAGHSNSDTDRETFGYTDGQGMNHPFLYSQGFDWVNGGFRQDEEGVTALVIKRGSSVTLDDSLFRGDGSASGKEIKLILRVANCKDYDATFLSCYSDPVGLILKAQEGILSSESQSLTIPWCEEEKLELDLNIESSKENRLATVWLSGVPSGVFAYATTDSWAQGIPQNLTIGSPDCDVWLYGIRLYGNSLTRQDILSNFIADAGTTEDMIARYERNDVYTAGGSLSLTKLRDHNPDLRILHIHAGDMTTGKSHEVSCSVDLSHKNGTGFSASGVVMKAQGTSSLEYGLAALNLDLDFASANWTDDKGMKITAFSMEEGSIPVNYFNIKLNVASSENANNVCLAEEYNSFNPYRSMPRGDNEAIRDTVEGHPCAVFLTNTARQAMTVGARTLLPGETMLYGCGDMNNSKKNVAVFGQDNSLYPKQCCIEILNNNNGPCRFKSDDLSTETWDGAEGTSNFEFRYPKNPTQEMKDSFQSLLTWVVSTDPAQATSQALLRPVQYGNVTYNTDSTEYRKAKFRAELADYFSVDSLLFHYLFTEYHLMVDNRAKNTFLSYEWDPEAGNYRWNFNKNYDNDTAAGTDNSGGLSFHYGLEDTDSVGAQKVFNAADSVLWCNLRDLFGPELKAMYHSLESQKVWDSSRILEHFRTYQGARPEILVAEDMWAKYFMPYINKGEKRYLEMAQGNKTYQRAGFYRYRQPYMSSKYDSPFALSDSLSLRANAVSDLSVTLYSDAYAHVKFGNAGSVKLRGKRGQVVPIPCSADTANDLETYLYSAGSISALGDLSGLMADQIELNSAVKLRNLPLGRSEAGYENPDLTQLSFGTITNLESMDLSGLTSLTGTLDLTQFDSLREILAAGTGITGVIFAPNAPVVRAALPPVGTLVLRGQRKLTALSLDPGNLRNLRLEDCPGLDSHAICLGARDLQRGRLTAVRWNNADTDLLLRLAGLAGYDEEGSATEHFVLTGSAHVTAVCQEELDLLHSVFPNLELTYERLVPAYTVTFLDGDGNHLTSHTVRQGGTCPDPVATGKIPTPTKLPTVESIFHYGGWDLPLTDIRGDSTVTAIFSPATRRYTVRWFDGPRLLQTDTVEVYDSVTYEGEALTSAEEDTIWIGWNTPEEELSSVTRDMDVYGVFLSPMEQQVSYRYGYDYLYSDDPKDSMAYTLEEFYTILVRGRAEEYFSPGDRIKLCVKTSAFADTTFVMQLCGFRHFRLAEGNGLASVVFGMVGVMNNTYAPYGERNNAGGWPKSRMASYLNTTVYDSFPLHWQNMIKTVKVLSTAGSTSSDIVSADNKLFLFSSGEVGFRTEFPYANEIDEEAASITFPVFTDNDSRIRKSYNGQGTAQNWSLRSPYVGSGGHIQVVTASGTAKDEYANIWLHVSFGFCM